MDLRNNVCVLCNAALYMSNSLIALNGQTLNPLTGIGAFEKICGVMHLTTSVLELNGERVGWWAVTSIHMVELCTTHAALISQLASHVPSRMDPHFNRGPRPRGW